MNTFLVGTPPYNQHAARKFRHILVAQRLGLATSTAGDGHVTPGIHPTGGKIELLHLVPQSCHLNLSTRTEYASTPAHIDNVTAHSPLKKAGSGFYVHANHPHSGLGIDTTIFRIVLS